MGKTKTIVVTGTHSTPALATIEELKKDQENDWQIYYLGRQFSMEGDKTPSPESIVFPEQGVSFIHIPAGRLQRRFTRYTVPSLLRIPWGCLVSLYWLFKIKPNIVCSFGGYVSVPVVLAAKLLAIPSLTHEQTATVGLANKINSFLVNRVAITFPQTRNLFPKGKTILTGNPIRSEIFDTTKPLHQFEKSRPTIYFTGGSQGASSLNEVIWSILPDLARKYNIIHQCGGHDYIKLKKQYRHLKKEVKEAYFLVDYIKSDSVGWALNSDLVVGRSGANTVLELAALARPAILIPLPKSANNEQLLNAHFLADQNQATIINQAEFSDQTLLATINQMMEHLTEYQSSACQVKEQIKTDAATRIVEQIQQLAK